jgi:hypothetical protein
MPKSPKLPGPDDPDPDPYPMPDPLPDPVPDDDIRVRLDAPTILKSPDPLELLQELAEMERTVRNAEDDIAATRATLKAQQERLIERLTALRQKVREIEAPPLPLFALDGTA